MTTKEKMLKIISELPEDATVEAAMEKLSVLAKIERGLAHDERGEILPHQEVKVRLDRRLKGESNG